MDSLSTPIKRTASEIENDDDTNRRKLIKLNVINDVQDFMFSHPIPSVSTVTSESGDECYAGHNEKIYNTVAKQLQTPVLAHTREAPAVLPANENYDVSKCKEMIRKMNDFKMAILNSLIKDNHNKSISDQRFVIVDNITSEEYIVDRSEILNVKPFKEYFETVGHAFSISANKSYFVPLILDLDCVHCSTNGTGCTETVTLLNQIIKKDIMMNINNFFNANRKKDHSNVQIVSLKESDVVLFKNKTKCNLHVYFRNVTVSIILYDELISYLIFHLPPSATRKYNIDKPDLLPFPYSGKSDYNNYIYYDKCDIQYESFSLTPDMNTCYDFEYSLHTNNEIKNNFINLGVFVNIIKKSGKQQRRTNNSNNTRLLNKSDESNTFISLLENIDDYWSEFENPHGFILTRKKISDCIKTCELPKIFAQLKYQNMTFQPNKTGSLNAFQEYFTHITNIESQSSNFTNINKLLTLTSLVKRQKDISNKTVDMLNCMWVIMNKISYLTYSVEYVCNGIMPYMVACERNSEYTTTVDADQQTMDADDTLADKKDHIGLFFKFLTEENGCNAYYIIMCISVLVSDYCKIEYRDVLEFLVDFIQSGFEIICSNNCQKWDLCSEENMEIMFYICRIIKSQIDLVILTKKYFDSVAIKWLVDIINRVNCIICTNDIYHLFSTLMSAVQSLEQLNTLCIKYIHSNCIIIKQDQRYYWYGNEGLYEGLDAKEICNSSGTIAKKLYIMQKLSNLLNLVNKDLLNGIKKKDYIKNIWINYIVENVNNAKYDTIKFNLYNHFIMTKYGIFNSILGLYMNPSPFLYFKFRKSYCALPALTNDNLTYMTKLNRVTLNMQLIRELQVRKRIVEVLFNKQDTIFYLTTMLPGLLSLGELLFEKDDADEIIRNIIPRFFKDKSVENNKNYYYFLPIFVKYNLCFRSVLSLATVLLYMLEKNKLRLDEEYYIFSFDNINNFYSNNEDVFNHLTEDFSNINVTAGEDLLVPVGKDIDNLRDLINEVSCGTIEELLQKYKPAIDKTVCYDELDDNVLNLSVVYSFLLLILHFKSGIGFLSENITRCIGLVPNKEYDETKEIRLSENDIKKPETLLDWYLFHQEHRYLCSNEFALEILRLYYFRSYPISNKCLNMLLTLSCWTKYENNTLKDLLVCCSSMYDPANNRKAMLVLEGPAKTGKTTFVKWIKNMNDPATFSMLKTMKLDNENSYSPSMITMCSSYFFYINELVRLDSELLKTITGDDTSNKRKIGSNDFPELQMFAFCIGCTNKTPKSNMVDEALRDRLVIVKLNIMFEHQKDKMENNPLWSFILNKNSRSDKNYADENDCGRILATILYETFVTEADYYKSSIKYTSETIRRNLWDFCCYNALEYEVLNKCNITLNESYSITLDRLRQEVSAVVERHNSSNKSNKLINGMYNGKLATLNADVLMKDICVIFSNYLVNDKVFKGLGNLESTDFYNKQLSDVANLFSKHVVLKADSAIPEMVLKKHLLRCQIGKAHISSVLDTLIMNKTIQYDERSKMYIGLGIE